MFNISCYQTTEHQITHPAAKLTKVLVPFIVTRPVQCDNLVSRQGFISLLYYCTALTINHVIPILITLYIYLNLGLQDL